MPGVSVVIPTRNRAHLLKVAIESALRQSWRDLEILVSDNYCGNEETRDVYASFNDPRLRYVRTPGLLAMPDSWEFALSHAAGDYLTILSDDSYLLSYAIERAMQAIGEFNVDLAVWNTCAYYAPDWLEPYLRNRLSVPEPPYDSRLMYSRDVLKDLYDLDFGAAGHTPRFLNSICHRRLVAKVLQLHGRMFIPPCPDYSAAACLLVHTHKYAFIGWPLGIDGSTPRSIGVTLGYGYVEAFKEFLAEFDAAADFRKSIDLQLGTVSVCVAQTLEGVRKSCRPECIPYRVNRRNMRLQSIASVATQERNGIDMRDAWRILDSYIARQPDGLKREAIAQKRKFKVYSVLRHAVAQLLNRLPGWQFLGRLRGRHIFHGAGQDFGNMQECGRIAPQLIARLAGRQ